MCVGGVCGSKWVQLGAPLGTEAGQNSHLIVEHDH